MIPNKLQYWNVNTIIHSSRICKYKYTDITSYLVLYLIFTKKIVDKLWYKFVSMYIKYNT